MRYALLNFIEKIQYTIWQADHAVAIDKEREQQFIERIIKITGKELEMELVVDTDIIGGFILNLDNYQWDASVQGELTRIRNRFKKTQNK